MPVYAIIADSLVKALRMSGKVSATRTVWCGKCTESYTAMPHASVSRAEHEWMRLGWCRFSRVWHCPACASTYRPPQPRRSSP